MRGREKKMLAAASVGLVDILGLPVPVPTQILTEGARRRRRRRRRKCCGFLFFCPQRRAVTAKHFSADDPMRP